MWLPQSPMMQPRQMLNNSSPFTAPAPGKRAGLPHSQFQRDDGTAGQAAPDDAGLQHHALHPGITPFRFHALRLPPLGPTLVPQAPRSLDVRAGKPCAWPLFNVLGSGEHRCKSTGPKRMQKALEVEKEL